MAPCRIYSKVVLLVYFQLNLVTLGFGYKIPKVTVLTINNRTAPICTSQHMCSNTGCSTNQTFPHFCYCDSACMYFDDCCIDYEEACSIDVENEFQKFLVTRQITTADFKCETTNVEDNESYWMISKCDKDLGLVSERCVNPICNDTLSSIPVTDSSGISYRNVYCAVCHNVETSELTAWEATYGCPSVVLLDQYAFDISQVCSECSFTLHPPTLPTGYLTSARTCEPDVIAKCPDDADNHCNSYTAIIRVDNKLFKNPHCYACGLTENIKSLDTLDCGKEWIPSININSSGNVPKPRISGPSVSVPLSVVLDFGLTQSSSVKFFHNHEIIKETVVSCPDGQVYLDLETGGKCLYLSCPRGFILREGDCVSDNPSNRVLPCANKGLNNTLILKATIATSLKSCEDVLFTNVSEEVLVHLFGHSLVFEDVYTERLTVCDGVFENLLNVTYTISSKIDLLEFVHDNLDRPSTWNYFVSTSGTSRYVRQVEIINSCLKLDTEYSCESDWISDKEYIIKNKNGSQLVFLNSTAKIQTTDLVLFRILYRSHNGTLGYTKNRDIKICHSNNYLSCLFLTMNRTFFEALDSTDGQLLYIPDGRILNSTEFMITSDDEILVCNFLNQSTIINVTDIVTFFEYSDAQTIVSIVGSVLSIVANILTFITYAVFASLRNRASKLIMNLILALFMGQFLLLFGGNSAQNQDVCFAIAVLAHYSWLAAFAWMNALAFDLNRTFGNPGNLRIMSQGNKSTILYMIYAWGMPLFVVIPCIAVHFCQCTTIYFKYGNINTCWITDGTANLLTFGSPAGIFLLFNLVLFVRIVTGIRSTKKSTARIQQETSTLQRSRRELSIYMKIASLIGFTWIFGYVAAFTGVEALWYIYIILNSLQGVFIFISFICNRQVAILWANKLKLSNFVASIPKTLSSGGTSFRSSFAASTKTTRSNSNNYARASSDHGIGSNDSTQTLKGEVTV